MLIPGNARVFRNKVLAWVHCTVCVGHTVCDAVEAVLFIECSHVRHHAQAGRQTPQTFLQN